ncbi:MAG: hypothetical protein AAFY53_12140 [Pseudomonadota bacterium]
MMYARFFGLVLACAACAVVGFMATLHFISAAPPVPDRETASLIDLTSSTARASGFSAPQPQGRTLIGSAATVELPIGGYAPRDLNLRVSVLAPKVSNPSPVFEVTFNNRSLGEITPTRRATPQYFELNIPKGIAYEFIPARLSIRKKRGNANQVRFQRIVAENLANPRNPRGYVDRCSSARVVGWAADAFGPAKLNVSVDGASWPYRVIRRRRPRLGRLGVDPFSGFELQLGKPVPADSTIAVKIGETFTLNGSPCRPSNA